MKKSLDTPLSCLKKSFSELKSFHLEIFLFSALQLTVFLSYRAGIESHLGQFSNATGAAKSLSILSLILMAPVFISVASNTDIKKITEICKRSARLILYLIIVGCISSVSALLLGTEFMVPADPESISITSMVFEGMWKPEAILQSSIFIITYLGTFSIAQGNKVSSSLKYSFDQVFQNLSESVFTIILSIMSLEVFLIFSGLLGSLVSKNVELFGQLIPVSLLVLVAGVSIGTVVSTRTASNYLSEKDTA